MTNVTFVPYLSNTSRVRAKGSGPDHLVLEWNEDVFSDYMGRLVRYSVLVGRVGSLGNATGGHVAENGPTWLSFRTGRSNFYQATNPWWNPFNGGPDPLECVSLNETEDDSNKTSLRCLIGIQISCLETLTYCNGPLEPNTEYEIKIRGFTEGGYNETYPVLARTGLPRNYITMGTIVTGVVLLFLVLLAGSGYVLKRKGYLDTLNKAIQSRFRQIRKPGADVLTASEQEMEQYPSPRPIKCKDFDDHIQAMIADSYLKFSQEFELLKKDSPHHSCTIAEMDENSSKNRQVNILPFDHSRVKLLPICDEPGSDFINANYIPGFYSRREYISSQGPLANTVDDFWRMISEQSISVVVMLTQCVERDMRAYKKKCEQYWPDSGETNLYGDLRVTCVSESVLPTYVIRIFNVQVVNDTDNGLFESYERQVMQMQFIHWPDFGSPETPEYLISFMRAVRGHLQEEKSGPILVHCSAGVGRTGSFIAVDRLSQQLFATSNNHDDDTVDIYSTVLELRNHRTNMVQTEDQYIYVYLCISQLIRERDKHGLKGCEELVDAEVQRNYGI